MIKKKDATSKLTGIELFLFPFEDCDSDSLKSIGIKVISQNSPTRQGKSMERMRSYWAGRCAVAVAFKRLGVQGWVQPNVEFGYLEVVNEKGAVLPNLYLNLSHTESIVALALAPYPVGVDIELADRDASRVITRVANSKEREVAGDGVFASNGKLINPDIALWSAKEAAAKAVGLGMKFGLNCFEVRFVKNDTTRVESTKPGPLTLKFPTIVIESFDPYIISVCSESEIMFSGRISRSLISSFDIG